MDHGRCDRAHSRCDAVSQADSRSPPLSRVRAAVRVCSSDMENALWGADKVVSNEEPITHDFVTAMIKGDSGAAPGHWAIKGGNAQAGMLKSYWDGHRAPHYAPMKKQV